MSFKLILKIPYFLVVRLLLIRGSDSFWNLLMRGRVLKADGRILKSKAQALINLQTKFSAPMEEWTPHLLRYGYDRSAGLFDGPKAALSNVENIDIPLEGRIIKGRFYGETKSSKNRPCILYFHGGGFVIGSLESHDRLCRKLAFASGQLVLAIDYRLGPEERFPAAFDDAIDVWKWIQGDAARFNIDTARMTVAGDSAGAALALLISAEASKGTMGAKPVTSGLIYPPLTSTPDTASRELLSKENIVLTQELLDWFSNNFFDDDLSAAEKYLAPLESATGGEIGPVWIRTCGFDPLRDDGQLIAQKLKYLKAEVDIEEYSGLYHGFIGASAIFPEVDMMVGELATFILSNTKQQPVAEAAE